MCAPVYGKGVITIQIRIFVDTGVKRDALGWMGSTETQRFDWDTVG